MIQHLPWENIPSLRMRCVSRMHSMHYLRAHVRALTSDPDSVYMTGVDLSNTYYLLDPEDNLEKTRKMFQKWFER